MLVSLVAVNYFPNSFYFGSFTSSLVPTLEWIKPSEKELLNYVHQESRELDPNFDLLLEYVPNHGSNRGLTKRKIEK